jgi:uncharacterized membrane protein
MAQETQPMKSSARSLPHYALIDLGTLEGGTVSEATAINNANQVVGWSNLGSVHQDNRRVDKSSFRHGFVWEDRRLRDLNPGDGVDIRLPRGINEAGTVVGISGNRAFVWAAEDGITDLNALVPAECDWTLTRANAINAGGAIVGQGLFHGQRHAFLALPSTPDGRRAWQ